MKVTFELTLKESAFRFVSALSEAKCVPHYLELEPKPQSTRLRKHLFRLSLVKSLARFKAVYPMNAFTEQDFSPWHEL